MTDTGNLQQISLIQQLIKKLKQIKPIYLISISIPFLLFYPKPIILLFKPIINRWSFYYNQINQEQNQPLQIILSSNFNLSYQKQFIEKISIVHGQLPVSFKKVLESSGKINDINQDKYQEFNVQNIIYSKKYQFQQQNFFYSCCVIDCYHQQFKKIQDISKSHIKASLVKSKLKNSTISQNNSEESKIHLKNLNTIKQQINDDNLWFQIILLNYKLITMQNNGQKIKYILIKANDKIIKMFQMYLLRINENDQFKLSNCSQNKIHTMKFNKKLNTYERCITTFQINNQK